MNPGINYMYMTYKYCTFIQFGTRPSWGVDTCILPVKRFFVGQDCTFERMDQIREQQERLARLHFELDSQQEVKG